MSRSYKKSFTSKQKNDGFMKKYSSKVLRGEDFGENEDAGKISNRSFFKRMLDSWNICDWSFYLTKHNFFKMVEERKGDKNLLRNIYSVYRNK